MLSKRQKEILEKDENITHGYSSVISTRVASKIDNTFEDFEVILNSDYRYLRGLLKKKIIEITKTSNYQEITEFGKLSKKEVI